MAIMTIIDCLLLILNREFIMRPHKKTSEISKISDVFFVKSDYGITCSLTQTQRGIADFPNRKVGLPFAV